MHALPSFFKPELGDRGYDSVYVKRPSIHVSNWSGEKKHDGCGIFYKYVGGGDSLRWFDASHSVGVFNSVASTVCVRGVCRKDKFELKECESINFHDPHDRVAILALLKMRHFAQFVLVGCTHLWWNAKCVVVSRLLPCVGVVQRRSSWSHSLTCACRPVVGKWTTRWPSCLSSRKK